MAEEQKERGLTTYLSRDGQTIKLSFDIVRKFFVSGKPEFVTEPEIVLYMGTCKARGLNPAKKDCYLVKYTKDDPAALIVSIDYFRSRAKAQEDCQGWKSGVIVRDEAGALVYRTGSFTAEGDIVLGGWFKAKPANWIEEYEWSVNLKPYVKQTRDGAVTWFWRDENQSYMIAKVAESQGLRRLWPDEFQGLFVHEEILDVTQNAPDAEAEPRKVLAEPVRKITEKERKRIVAAGPNININVLQAKLAEYGFQSTHEITTDKLPELTAWAEAWEKMTAEEKPPPVEEKPENGGS
jgi:phage recombination protein Bet